MVAVGPPLRIYVGIDANIHEELRLIDPSAETWSSATAFNDCTSAACKALAPKVVWRPEPTICRGENTPGREVRSAPDCPRSGARASWPIQRGDVDFRDSSLGAKRVSACGPRFPKSDP